MSAVQYHPGTTGRETTIRVVHEESTYANSDKSYFGGMTKQNKILEIIRGIGTVTQGSIWYPRILHSSTGHGHEHFYNERH